MNDRNSDCTKNGARCWFVPGGYTITLGSRFDPRALGWQEDINCVSYNAANEDCATCLENANCSSPEKTATTSLSRRIDNTGMLTVKYGVVSDTLVYRLVRDSDKQAVWTAQSVGGYKSFTVNYQFPSSGTYTLTVEKVGQSDCMVSEKLTISGTIETPTGEWMKDGDEYLVG